jgi:hypothetical protein
LLYSGAGSIPQNTILFDGYVGPWPYINLFADPNTGTENVTIYLEWYSDSTFTKLVGFRYAPRNQFSLSATQYANLSPWLRVFYTTSSGNPITWVSLAVYGATGVADANALLSSDAPLITSSASIPANTTVTVNIGHVGFGDAEFVVSTALASWYVNFFYQDALSYTGLFYTQINSSWAGSGGSFSVPALDSPHTLQVHNGTAAAGTINYCWTLK